jgi:hypothetical protein
VNGLGRLLADRRRRQSGSILSGLLIIVALLAILIGALMTELSSSFLLSRTATARVQHQATVNSAMEWGLYQLQNSAVPHVCVRDTRGPWFLNALNGSAAAVSQTCTGIVPDVSAPLGGGNYAVDGIHEAMLGHNSYIVGGQTGRLTSHAFGTSTLEWSINVGGAPTAQVLAKPDPSNSPHIALLVPNAASRSSCGGHCVSLYDQGSGAPAFRCDMAAGAAVTDQPALEMSGGGGANFPTYAFFGDSAGKLYVYEASTNGTCDLLAALGGAGGAVVGQPVVFTGTSSSRSGDTTVVDDIFVVVSTSSSTSLEHWQYSETTAQGEDEVAGLGLVSMLPLAVGGNAVVSDPSSTVPSGGAVIRQAVVGRGGRVGISLINVTSTKAGFTYTVSAGPTAPLAGQVTHQPYWCHCPGGDTIGVGSTNGFLYLLDTSLNLSRQYDGQADGQPAINSTPVADAAGDWYFGADDGYVYDVEIPATGLQMFKAARFGPGGAIQSSPIEGTCGTATCLYFASSTAGAYFVDLAATRVIDLRACISAGPGSSTCAANPRLWAKVMVGPPGGVAGDKGIAVQGWSYYSYNSP